MASSARYMHGHAAGVLKSHEWRTAQNSAAYLLPHIGRSSTILDVGCGPGTITADFAELTDGAVVGVDADAAIVAAATAKYSERANVRFAVADVTARLPFADASFDVVHAHQLLQHVADPAAALREMRRVCRRGGVVAARDADYHGMVWAPAIAGLDTWMRAYQGAARACGGDPDMGRSLLRCARDAGFTDIRAGSSTWCFADDDRREWWGSLWADRVCNSRLHNEMQAVGITDAEIAEMRRAWIAWKQEPAGWFAVVHGEVLCIVP